MWQTSITFLFTHIQRLIDLAHETRHTYTDGRERRRERYRQKYISRCLLCSPHRRWDHCWVLEMWGRSYLFFCDPPLPIPTPVTLPLFVLASLTHLFLSISYIQPVNKLKIHSSLQRFLTLILSFLLLFFVCLFV